VRDPKVAASDGADRETATRQDIDAMPGIILRLVTGLAMAVGYVPTGSSWRDRLLILNGEYRRSTSDKIFRYALEGMITMSGALLFGSSCRQYLSTGSGGWLVPCLVSIVIVASAFYALSRNGIWYKFQRGSLSAFSASGKLLWHEDLAGLEEVLCTRGRGIVLMTLLWPERKRKMELYASLEAVLSDRDT
jgi:hypothetical protein